MRVLIVSSYPPRHCGIGAYARDQVERLRSRSHEVTVLSPPDGEGDVRVPFFGGRPFIRALGIGRRFDRILVHFQPGLYFRPHAPISKMLSSLGLLALVLFRRRAQILVHEADTPIRWRPDYLLLGAAFSAAPRVWFHTESERVALEREYHVSVRGSVIPHLVGAGRGVGREEARARLGIENGGPLFVCVGFLQPSKGFDRAVEAIGGTNGGTLYVVGSVRDPTPENEAYLRELRDRSNALPNVRLVERFVPDDEFDLWVAAADWVVLPYRRSWSSGVLARAHALGTPAIVSAVGGLPEQAGEHDIVVGDDDELRRALRDPAWRAEVMKGPGLSGGRPREGTLLEEPQDWDPSLEVSPDSRRKGRAVLIGMILLSVLLAALAQLTLKHAMDEVTRDGAVPLSLTDISGTARRVMLNPFVWGGLFAFVLSASVWLIVLSRATLSFAYPFASLTYVLILLVDRFVLKSPISGLRYGGVALIMVGLVLISRTHQVS